MRRRGATLLAGAVVLAVLVALSFWEVKVPYVALTPGPTWNTLGSDHGKEVIQVSGGSPDGAKSRGQLRMVTVGVEDQISLWDAVRGWLDASDAVVPREVIYPPDQTQQQVDQQNQTDFKQSENSAQVAALRQLGYPVVVTVQSVGAGQPAQGHLAGGDVITSVDGQPVESAHQLTDLIRSRGAGVPLTIGYTRGGQAGVTTVKAAKDDSGNPRIGVQVVETPKSPYQITITLNDVGGPSAGLMFSLGIIDKLQPLDLTGGMIIAGTGTIDGDGTVGAIGGVPQKMRAARRDGATIFLTPSDNCAEARANAVPGLKLVRVKTLKDAVDALATLRASGAPPLC